jgi:hypothetical protein
MQHVRRTIFNLAVGIEYAAKRIDVAHIDAVALPTSHSTERRGFARSA